MYKLIITMIVAGFLFHSAVVLKTDMTNKIHSHLMMIDNIAK